MKGLTEIRHANGTGPNYRHRPIIQRDGKCWYREADDSLTRVPWERDRDRELFLYKPLLALNCSSAKVLTD